MFYGGGDEALLAGSVFEDGLSHVLKAYVKDLRSLAYGSI